MLYLSQLLNPRRDSNADLRLRLMPAILARGSGIAMGSITTASTLLLESQEGVFTLVRRDLRQRREAATLPGRLNCGKVSRSKGLRQRSKKTLPTSAKI